MNLFYLDMDLVECARCHVDKHVVKMPTEAMQVVSTALYMGPSVAWHAALLHTVLYKPTHKHHPLVLWAARSLDNAMFVCDYGIAVAQEYEYRYKREMLTYARLVLVRQWLVNNGASPSSHSIPECMPPEYRLDRPVLSYRNYYIHAKAHLHVWTNRTKPSWVP